MSSVRLKQRWEEVYGLNGDLVMPPGENKVVGLGGERVSVERGTGERRREFTTDSGRLKERWVGVQGLDGSYTSGNFTLEVHANKIDRKNVLYLCLFCDKTHRHGSGGETHNRVEHRSTHCRKRRPHDVEINITDETGREAVSPSAATRK